MKKITSLLALFLVVLGMNAQGLTVEQPLNRNGWSVKVDSYSPEGDNGGLAQHAIDDNRNTYWHSNWGNGKGEQLLPHHLVINLGDVVEFSKVKLLPRNHASGKIKDYSISISDNDAVFTDEAVADPNNDSNWTIVKSGSLENSADEKTIDLEKVYKAKYIRLKVTANYAEGKFVCVNDFNLFKDCVGTEVTYNYILDGKIVRTDKKVQAVGDEFSAPFTNDFFTAKISTSGKVSESNNTVEVECVENLPFVKTINKETPVWYVVDIHKYWGTYYWYYESSHAEKIQSKTPANGRLDVESLSNSEYQWCFVGDALNGFTIYNKAKGFEYALSNTDNYASLVNSVEAKKWMLVKSAVLEGAYALTADGTNYINRQEGEDLDSSKEGNDTKLNGWLKYWNQADQGSSCHFYTINELKKEIAEAPAVELLNKAKALVPAFPGAVGTNLYFSKNLAVFQNAVETLEADKTNTEKLEVLQTEVAKVEAEKAVVELVPGNYYRIKNGFRNLTLHQGSNVGKGEETAYMSTTSFKGEAGISRSVSCHTTSLADAGCVWVFEATATENQFVIKNLNLNKYLSITATDHSNYVTMVDKAEAGLYNLIDHKNSRFSFECASEGVGEHKQLHASGYGVMNYNGSANDASAWYIIPATELEVNMNKVKAEAAESWASLYLPFGVKLANGVEAYAGKINGNVMNLTKVDEVPANYGVILKGTDAKYTLTIAEVATSTVSNDLKGTNVDLAKVENSVVLGNNNGVGLYAPKAEKLLANKAYAVVNGAAAVNGLKFVFGEATGVEGVEVETENANAVYYDLSGRRVVNPTKGIYVVNGKKVYVK